MVEKWKIPPKVKWASRGDRERTRNHAKVKARYAALVAETWARIPPSGRVAIVGNPTWVGSIELVHLYPGEAKERGGGSFRGQYHSGLVSLNVWNHPLHKIMERLSMQWVTAHELAHAYLDCFAIFGRMGWTELIKRPEGRVLVQ